MRIAAVLSCMAAAAAAQGPVPVGGHRQLFIDDRFVRDARGIEWQVHAPRKTGELTLTSAPPLELGGTSHCAMKIGNRYYLWYTAGESIAYAWSEDGVHFAAPPDNVVVGRGAGGIQDTTRGLMVFLDPNAPPDQRYRMVARAFEFNRMVQIFSSPDGIRWRLTHRDVITFDENRKPHHLDTQNVVFWDDRIGKYVAYVRRNLPKERSQGRTIARAESSDLGKFGTVEENTRVVFSVENFRKQAAGFIDIYTNGVFQYPWAEDAYFMFPGVYYQYGPRQREFRPGAPVNAGVLDARFASSRDGIRWNTYNWGPFVPVGMDGAFDSRRIYMVYGIVLSPDEREMYMYYMGTNEPHGWGRDDRNNALLTAAGVAPKPPRRAISRLVLRRDGFVSVRASAAGGEFTTPPLTFQGNQLVLNVDTSALGEVQVEIQDESGKPLPGHALADGHIIHSANDVDRAVTWNGSSDLEKLAGKTIRLRFVLRDADLYAFQFRARPGF